MLTLQPKLLSYVKNSLLWGLVALQLQLQTKSPPPNSPGNPWPERWSSSCSPSWSSSELLARSDPPARWAGASPNWLAGAVMNPWRFNLTVFTGDLIWMNPWIRIDSNGCLKDETMDLD
jgi:hypothetical protein